MSLAEAKKMAANNYTPQQLQMLWTYYLEKMAREGVLRIYRHHSASGTIRSTHGQTAIYLFLQAVSSSGAHPAGQRRARRVPTQLYPAEVEEIFWRQLKHEEFDIAEMSLSSYVMARSRGDERFVAIPVFTLRIFRHSCIYINVHKGIKTRGPAGQEGRRSGVPDDSLSLAERSDPA